MTATQSRSKRPSRKKQSRKKQRSLIRVVGIPDVDTTLDIVGMRATERLSTPFEVHVELKPVDPSTFDLDEFGEAMIGKDVGVSLLPSENAADAERHFHGEVVAVHLVDWADEGGTPHLMVELRPSLCQLSNSAGSRLFTEKTTQDIVAHVLDSHGLAGYYQWSASPSAKPRIRPHCWQLHETDLQFVQRLLDEEGYVYWFTFSENGHQLHIADGPQHLPTLRGEPLRIGAHGNLGKGCVAYLRRSVKSGAASYVVRGRSADGKSVLRGDANSSQSGRSGTIHDTDGIAKTVSDCKTEAVIRLATLEMQRRTAEGRSDVRALSAGTVASIVGRGKNSPDSYRITGLQHEATQSTACYSNHFEAVAGGQPVRHDASIRQADVVDDAGDGCRRTGRGRRLSTSL